MTSADHVVAVPAAILHPVSALIHYIKISMIKLAVIAGEPPTAFLLDCNEECSYWQLPMFSFLSLGGRQGRSGYFHPEPSLPVTLPLGYQYLNVKNVVNI